MTVPMVCVLSMHTSPLAQPGSADAGGMNVYVRELAAAMAQRGVRVRVYTRRSAERSDRPVVEVEPNLSVVTVPAGDPDLPKEALPDLVDRFADAVGEDLADVGVPTALHANYWLSGIAGLQLAAEHSVPLAVSFHTLARVKASHGDPEPRGRADAEQRIVEAADVLCAASTADADDLVDSYGADPRRVVRVPPGVQHAFFSPGSRHGARWALGLDDRPMVLFVGRIQALKRLDLAVAALARLGDDTARLLAIGGPSGRGGATELTRIHNLVAAAGLGDRVRIVAPQPHHVLSTYYRAADVVVVPSRTESFGLVALEAASCGRPVIAADVGGLRDLVVDGLTGLRVSGSDPNRWASSIDRLLGDEDLARRMGSEGARLGARFRWSATAAGVLDALGVEPPIP